MFDVVLLLDTASAVRLGNGPLHRVGDRVGVHDDLTVDVPGGASDRLHERRFRSEEPLLVRIEDGDQRDLGEIEALPEEIDADENVEFAEPKIPQDLDALDRVDLAVEIADLHPQLEEIVREIFGHLLGQGGHQDTVALRHPLVDLLDQIVDLSLGGLDDDLGIDKSGRANDLLDDDVGVLEFERARCCRQEHHLTDPVHDLLELQRPVVGRRRETEAVVDQCCLPGLVSGELSAQLRHSLMTLVHDDEEVVREIIEQGEGWFAGLATVDLARIILDPVAVSELGHHLEVVLRAHPQTLCLEELPFLLELGQLLLQFVLDSRHGTLHPVFAGDVMGGREDDQLLELGDLLARDGIDHDDPFDLVAEEFDPHGGFVIRGMDFDRVTPHAELAPDQIQVVALVLHVDEATENRPLFMCLAGAQHEELVLVFEWRSKAVDARHRGDDDRVSSRQQGRGCSMSQPIDLVVHRRVLLDVRVRGGHVCLGLVIVVIRHEILDAVRGEELAELVGELGGEGLVRRHDQSGTLQLLDRPCDRSALSRPGDAQKGLEAVSGFDALRQFLDGLGLIPRRHEVGFETKRRHAESLGMQSGDAPGSTGDAVYPLPSDQVPNRRQTRTESIECGTRWERCSQCSCSGETPKLRSPSPNVWWISGVALSFWLSETPSRPSPPRLPTPFVPAVRQRSRPSGSTPSPRNPIRR